MQRLKRIKYSQIKIKINSSSKARKIWNIKQTIKRNKRSKKEELFQIPTKKNKSKNKKIQIYRNNS